MRILLAPDKFKGSLTAADVSAHLSCGLRRGRPDLQLTELPMADGGDGTVAAAVAAGYLSVPVQVTGPTGEPVLSAFALSGLRAVVELADACGLGRLPGGVLMPMTATSRGLGDVILAAARAGASRIVVGIGGSASTDGGAGMLQALGVEVLDSQGAPVGPGAAGLDEAASVDVSTLDPVLRNVEISLAVDVDNPLLGSRGAAAVYGRQKGADADQIRQMDAILSRWAGLVARNLPGPFADAPGAGAAGGVGFAALAVLGARPRPGIELMMELTGFAAALAGADLVITGEGSLDAQTLQGKGPAGIAAACRTAGVPVLAVAGRVLLDRDQLLAAGFRAAYALLDLEPDPVICMAEAGRLLEEIGSRIASGLPGS